MTPVTLPPAWSQTAQEGYTLADTAEFRALRRLARRIVLQALVDAGQGRRVHSDHVADWAAIAEINPERFGEALEAARSGGLRHLGLLGRRLGRKS